MKTLKFLPIILIISLLSCNNNSNEETKEGPEEKNIRTEQPERFVQLTDNQKKEANIQTGTLLEKNISEKISCSGEIEVSPTHIVTVIPPLKGYIRELYHKTGDYVNKGEKLARLSHPEYLKIQEEYISVKSQTEYYKKEYQRQGELAVEKAASMKKMQKAKANYEDFNARYKSLKILLKKLNINPKEVEKGNLSTDVYLYSPINGYITDLFLNVGKISSENNPVYEIMNMDNLHLKINVYEKDISDLSKGQNVEFSIVKNAEQKYNAKIKYIGNKIDKEKRTFPVIAELNNLKNQFKHGLYVNADILLSSKSKFVLPNEAITRIDGETYVFFVKDKGYLPVKVTTGNQGDNYTEILNHKELNNKEIVINGAYFLSGELSLD
jgi:cobalt-zinc-cadmium efflux system membrane fusion protein